LTIVRHLFILPIRLETFAQLFDPKRPTFVGGIKNLTTRK
jgi:hypothetical protein